MCGGVGASLYCVCKVHRILVVSVKEGRPNTSQPTMRVAQTPHMSSQASRHVPYPTCNSICYFCSHLSRAAVTCPCLFMSPGHQCDAEERRQRLRPRRGGQGGGLRAVHPTGPRRNARVAHLPGLANTHGERGSWCAFDGPCSCR